MLIIRRATFGERYISYPSEVRIPLRQVRQISPQKYVEIKQSKPPKLTSNENTDFSQKTTSKSLFINIGSLFINVILGVLLGIFILYVWSILRINTSSDLSQTDTGINVKMEYKMGKILKTLYIKTYRCNVETRKLKLRINKLEDMLFTNNRYKDEKITILDYPVESLRASAQINQNIPSDLLEMKRFRVPRWKFGPFFFDSNVLIKLYHTENECFESYAGPITIPINLTTTTYVKAVALEHIIYPLDVGTTPKQWTVKGITENNATTELGTFEFDNNGATIQIFMIEPKKARYPFKKLELNINSNYGNELYTCFIKFKVYGTPVD